MKERGYRSPLASWYSRATVRRSGPHPLTDTEESRVFFPPELEPVARHPAVTGRGQAFVNRLLIERLHLYLAFTVELEATTVVPVASAIARSRCGLDLPAAMRADAFKIATDEAWHAQFSHELIDQVAARTGVPSQPAEVPAFSSRLAASGAKVPPSLSAAHDLLASVVSETLISSLLAGLPHDARLPAAVRAAIADHAEDEGRHHAYFQQLLEYLWPALSVRERRLLGPLVPELITAFLAPDAPALDRILRRAGLGEDEARMVLTESLVPHEVRESVAGSARWTVKYFAGVGALDDATTNEAFAAAGLLDRA